MKIISVMFGQFLNSTRKLFHNFTPHVDMENCFWSSAYLHLRIPFTPKIEMLLQRRCHK